MTAAVSSSTPVAAVTGFVRRKPLDEVVDELVVGLAAGLPFDHVCRPTRWQQCTHDGLPRRSLLDRLAELSIPAQEMLPSAEGPSGGAGHRGGKRPAGSPAPWSAPAAELLDEILQGALAAQLRGRRALGLEPFTVPVRHPNPEFVSDRLVGPRHRTCAHESCRSVSAARWLWVATPAAAVALRDAGYAALTGLPGLVDLLAAKDHPLGVRISASGRRTQGKLEEQLRTWHQRALTMTGHQLPLERLPDVPNPDHPWAGDGLRLQGPACAVVLCGHESCVPVRSSRHGARFGPVCSSCGHESCRRARAARRRWIRWTCPACGSDSLRRDPVTDQVHCLRSACVDDQEQRSTWSMADLQAGSSDPWGDRAE